jgi:hypothetical protein
MTAAALSPCLAFDRCEASNEAVDAATDEEGECSSRTAAATDGAAAATCDDERAMSEPPCSIWAEYTMGCGTCTATGAGIGIGTAPVVNRASTTWCIWAARRSAGAGEANAEDAAEDADAARAADEAPASPCERWAEEAAAKAPAVDANDRSEPEPEAEARERLRCVFLGRSAGGGSLRRGAGVLAVAMAVAVPVLADVASDVDCALPSGGTMLICTPWPACLAAMRGGGIGGAGD